jgi:hypothetical protein
MPDGDSLNWKVRGTGSRRVLGLVRSGADCRLVAGEALRMFVKQANEGSWKPAIHDLAGALESALSQVPPDADFAKRADVFDGLSRRINRIVTGYADEGVMILGRAAERAFGALEESSGPLTAESVEQELLSHSVRALVDHRVLQPTRDDVAREAHRDSSEQVCYERELLSAVGEEGKRLHRTVFANSDKSGVRTPRRSVPPKETTMDRLREGLPVLRTEEN